MLRSLLLTSFTILTLAANAQEKKPFVLGIIDNVPSKILHEDRKLNIYLPDGYSKDTAHYPVLYLLDGSADEDFIHIVGIVQFLNMIQAMPKTIVVGIANVDRRRDFSYPTSVDSDRIHYPTTGGSGKFISFLEKELEPYVTKNYRTTATKTLIGQSFGGLLATEILLSKPELFNNYLIVSPSLWWGDGSLLHDAPKLLGRQAHISLNVYISVGSEGREMEGDANLLITELKNHGWPTLKSTIDPLPKEDHLTILHNAAYRGLIYLNKKD